MQKSLLIFLLFFSVLAKAQDIDVIHYKFVLELTDKNDTLKGLALITFVMKAESKQITLDLSSVSEDGKGMKVLFVSDGINNSSGLSFSQAEEKVLINIPYIKNGDTSSIAIVYQGIPDDGLIVSRNKFGERTFFADNWPNRAHHWLPCNDRPDDKAMFEFRITAPAQYSVVANGRKNGEKILPDGNKRTVWTEEVPLPTKVMSIGVARFAVKTFDDSPPNIPVSAWVYPKDSTKGFTDLAVTPEIVKFFSDYVAPFPYNKLANVQSTTIFGGMENASCIFYDENLITGNRSFEDVIAHEIAHQWFGDNATEKSFAHLWLSEGFATYMTNLYWEKKYGREAMNERLEDDREKIIDFAESSPHPVVDSTENLMSLLNANSYQKGGWILHMLRNEVGDSVFHQIIRSYYDEYKGSNAETRDFETVAEKVSGKDLKWFFDQWLYRPGVPQLDFTFKKENHKLTLTIIQKQKELYSFSLRIGYVIDFGRICMFKKIKVSEKITQVELPRNSEKIYTGITDVLCEGSKTISTK